MSSDAFIENSLGFFCLRRSRHRHHCRLSVVGHTVDHSIAPTMIKWPSTFWHKRDATCYPLGQSITVLLRPSNTKKIYSHDKTINKVCCLRLRRMPSSNSCVCCVCHRKSIRSCDTPKRERDILL